MKYVSTPAARCRCILACCTCQRHDNCDRATVRHMRQVGIRAGGQTNPTQKMATSATVEPSRPSDTHVRMLRRSAMILLIHDTPHDTTITSVTL